MDHLVEHLLTVEDVAKLLKLSVLTIYKYIHTRELEAIQLGGQYRIQKSALIAFISKNKVGGSQ